MNRDINEIIDEMKEKIVARDGEKEVLDKEVAEEINITSNHLAIHKKRGTIPVVKIMDWCIRNNVDMKTVFYKG